MSIEYIDIVHHLHTDLGYTDYPLRARKLHAQYVGEAVDAVLDTANRPVPFAWTCETLLGVEEWLRQADETQRDRFYQAVTTGNLDITMVPFNVTPFLSQRQWDKLVHWMPEDFYQKVSVRTAMQNDINGFPAAAAQKLLDRGVRYLWMGPNLHLGGVPFTTPHAFRWKMPDGRSLLVWLNGHYNNGFYIFNEFWREGPIPNSSDTCYRWPDAQDIFRTDDASLEKAHAQCLKCMATFEGREPNAGQFVRDGFVFNKITGVYPYRTLCLSLTNHWRMDNDPPILHLHEFVERWNAKGYTPKLRLVTATQAMRHIEEEAGDNLDVVEGEWPDWWANGILATPRELAWARKADRVYEAALSQTLGAMSEADQRSAARVERNLCLYGEHTFSNWKSIAEPYHFDSVAAEAEVRILAYRALDEAQGLLSDRLRRARSMDKPGVWVANTGDEPYRGWISLPRNSLRGAFTHLRDSESGALYRLEAQASCGEYNRPNSASEVSTHSETTDFPDQTPAFRVRFWVDDLPAQSLTCLQPCNASEPEREDALRADIRTDEKGWPVSICYAGQKASLIQPGLGDFSSVSVDEFAPRWAMLEIFDQAQDAAKAARNAARLRTTHARYAQTQRIESAHDVRFVQDFDHPSLKWGQRILTISKAEPHARLTLRVRRRDNPNPEIYFAKMQVAEKAETPRMSLAGRAFVPGSGQIPGTCMDYYTIDGWVSYKNDDAYWLISSRDAAMVSLGGRNCFAKIDHLPENTETLYYRLFDNTWDTNFEANSMGLFEYRFDLAQSAQSIEEQAAAKAMMNEPSVLVNLRS